MILHLFGLMLSSKKAGEERYLTNINSHGKIILEGWWSGEKSSGCYDG